MGTTAINDMDYRFKNVAMEFLARLTESHIPVAIINVLRTPEEQADNLAKGVSWTSKSLHLPQPPDGRSLAMDICPYAQFEIHGANKLQWDASDPVWDKIGNLAESLGLRWGGRWQQRDMGHVEWVPLADRSLGRV